MSWECHHKRSVTESTFPVLGISPLIRKEKINSQVGAALWMDLYSRKHVHQMATKELQCCRLYDMCCWHCTATWNYVVAIAILPLGILTGMNLCLLNFCTFMFVTRHQLPIIKAFREFSQKTPLVLFSDNLKKYFIFTPQSRVILKDQHF